MSIWDKLLGIGAVAAIVGLFIVSSKNESSSIEETKKRRDQTVDYTEGIPKGVFEDIVHNAGRRIKRIKKLEIDNTDVRGEVESQSGISTWTFLLDYNDYGKITGEYWSASDNQKSKIPCALGDRIKEQIGAWYAQNPSKHVQDEDDISP